MNTSEKKVTATRKRKGSVIITEGGRSVKGHSVNKHAVPVEEPMVQKSSLNSGSGERDLLRRSREASSESSQVGHVVDVAVMPLAALLPSLGDIKGISASARVFEAKLQELSERSPGLDEESEKERSSEESMLTQVLTWLSIGQSE